MPSSFSFCLCFHLNGDSDNNTFIVFSFLILEIDDNNNLYVLDLGDLKLKGSKGSDLFDFHDNMNNSIVAKDNELPDYVVNTLVALAIIVWLF